MIFVRSKEVLIIALLATMAFAAKKKAKNAAEKAQGAQEITNGSEPAPTEQVETNKVDAIDSMESEAKSEPVEPVQDPNDEKAKAATEETEINGDKANNETTNDIEKNENVQSGYYSKVEKDIENQTVDTATTPSSPPTKERLTLLGLLFFLTSTLTVFGFAVLVISSVYYRAYLKQNKTAPFEAPDALNLFFPKPVNYEYEINNLCSKYLDN